MEINESLDADDRYMPQFTPLRLQVLASYSISRKILYDLCRSPQSKEYRKRDILTYDIVKNGKCEAAVLIKKLKFPRIIEEILLQSMDETLSTIKDFIHHFAQNFSFDYFNYNKKTNRNYSLHVVDFECCVWSGNGVINYRKTAMNILATGKLCSLQRFAIYCEFCMENEILNLSLNSLSNPNIVFLNWLPRYWINYLKKTLNVISLDGYNSLDAAMAAKCIKKSITSGAFEFFWNRLTVEEQISFAVKMISALASDTTDTCGYYIYTDPYCRLVKLLSVMSWHQQRAVLAEVPDKIILNFLLYLKSPQSAMWAWKHCKELMTAEQFASVVKEVTENRSHVDDTMKMLIEIWHSASTALKTRAVDMLASDIISMFLCRNNNTNGYEVLSCSVIFPLYESSEPVPKDCLEHVPCQAAFEFLHAFLSVYNATFRMKFIIDRMPDFARCFSDPRPLAEIIKLCLPHPDQQSTFKHEIANSEEMKEACLTLYSSCCFNTLTMKLKFYFPNVAAIEKFVRQLVQSQISRVYNAQFMYDIDKWKNFGKFAEKIFAHESSVLEVKRLLILSFVPRTLFGFGLTERHLKSLNEVVKSVSVLSDEDLSTFKQKFLNMMKRAASKFCAIYYKQNDSSNFLKFLSWCMDDDLKNILEFESSSLPVDVVFDEIFAKLAALYDFRYALYGDSVIGRLNKCLNWYLKNDREINEYKLKRINKPDDFKLFEMLLNENDDSEFNKSFLKLLLEWFFNDDEKSIEEFRAKNARFANDS